MPEASVVAIYTAPKKHEPVVSRNEVEAVAGKGLEGDRYFNAAGWDEAKREITLVESEAIEAANRDYDLGLTAEDMRRQIVTQGVALNHLIGREFTVGGVRCRGVKLNEPCNHLRKLTGKPLIKPMIHRGGLRAQILESGTIRVGDPIATFSPPALRASRASCVERHVRSVLRGTDGKGPPHETEVMRKVLTGSTEEGKETQMFQVIAAGQEVPPEETEGFGSIVKKATVLVTAFLVIALALAALAPVASAAEASQQTADTTQASIARLTITWDAYVLDDLTDSWTKLSFESGCSGFVADPDGYVVTAGHCLDPDLAADSAIELRAQQLFKQNSEVFEAKGISLEQLIAYAQKNWQVEGRTNGSDLQPQVEVVLPGGESSEDPVTYEAEVLDVDATNDVGLLKIEATGLPSLELADEDGIGIGESVFAVGFPALRDSVTDPSLRPTFKSGSISDTEATREHGEVPVYETSAPMGQGMSGGPTVNAEGEVVGVNSYGTNLNNDFNWIAPAHLVSDMLDENGVAPELGQTDVLFRQALDAYYSGDYRSAAAKLQAVLDDRPDHPVALGLIEEATEKAKTQPLAQSPGLNLPMAPVGIAAAILATLGVSFLMGRSFARKVGHGTPQGGMAMAMPSPVMTMPAPMSSRQVPVPPRPIPASPAPPVPTPIVQPRPVPAPVAEPRVAQPTPVGFQPPVKAEATRTRNKFCTGCGTSTEPGAHFCRSCGTQVG